MEAFGAGDEGPRAPRSALFESRVAHCTEEFDLSDHRAMLANLSGAIAVVLWGALPALKLTNKLPPFLLLTCAFAVSGFTALIVCSTTGQRFADLLPRSAVVWSIGSLGMFGSFFTVFAAYDLAPPVEVHLISYLWPVFIALLSGLLPNGHPLRRRHLMGISLGLIGFVILISDNGLLKVDPSHLDGYLLALASAVVWTVYSLYTGVAGNVHPLSVGWFCWASGLFALMMHLAFEPWPTSLLLADLWSTLAIGAGPLGIAFFAWTFGLQHGKARAISIAAYFVPAISAGLLYALGYAGLSDKVFLSIPLITLAVFLSGSQDFRQPARTT